MKTFLLLAFAFAALALWISGADSREHNAVARDLEKSYHECVEIPQNALRDVR